MQYQEIERKLIELDNLIKKYCREDISNDQLVEAKIPFITELDKKINNLWKMTDQMMDFHCRLVGWSDWDEDSEYL